MRHAFQATELAHEAAIRLIGVEADGINGKAHLLALAALTMRRILIDEARKAAASKRQKPVFHTVWPDDAAGGVINLDDLDRSLIALAEVSPQHAQIVELRFMLGLTVQEAAQASGIPERTVKRRWQAARVWLQDHLSVDGVAILA